MLQIEYLNQNKSILRLNHQKYQFTSYIDKKQLISVKKRNSQFMQSVLSLRKSTKTFRTELLQI